MPRGAVTAPGGEPRPLRPSDARDLAEIARRLRADPLAAPLAEFVLSRFPAIARAARRLEAEALFADLRAEGHSNRAAARLTAARYPDAARDERTVRRWRSTAGGKSPRRNAPPPRPTVAATVR